jgi:hypothetical protein
MVHKMLSVGYIWDLMDHLNHDLVALSSVDSGLFRESALLAEGYSCD